MPPKNKLTSPSSRLQRIDKTSSQHWRVAVLSGGESAEREISLQSGATVSSALQAGGHDVWMIDPREVMDLSSLDWSGTDVAFIALHGAFGEDGQVQEALDDLGIPYTGSGVEASRLAFSKAESKERFLASEVPTPDYHLVMSGASETMLKRAAEQVGYPLVVKPDRQGSSLGVSLVSSPAELLDAWNMARKFDSRILLEQAILGTEWTVPLLDRQTLPTIQIRMQSRIFDFKAKYLDEQTTYSFGTNTPVSIVRTLEDAAIRACSELGVQGLARVDLRLDQANCPWVLEVNTVPGMTDHSLVPKAASRLGWTLTELCERAIESALRGTHQRGVQRQEFPLPHLRHTPVRTSVSPMEHS